MIRLKLAPMKDIPTEAELDYRIWVLNQNLMSDPVVKAGQIMSELIKQSERVAPWLIPQIR